MVEWHVTPDYIVNNWTDELFDLMTEKYIERRQRESRASSPAEPIVSDEMFYAQASNMIEHKVVENNG